MSILNKIFGNAQNDGSGAPFWKYIESEADLKNAVAESFDRKVAIFKHSTRCFISKTVLKNFEREVRNSDHEVSYYFLDLLENRNISDQIAEAFGVTHQSPQLIVLRDGEAVKDASHQAISLSLLQ